MDDKYYSHEYEEEDEGPVEVNSANDLVNLFWPIPKSETRFTVSACSSAITGFIQEVHNKYTNLADEIDSLGSGFSVSDRYHLYCSDGKTLHVHAILRGVKNLCYTDLKVIEPDELASPQSNDSATREWLGM